MRETPPRTGRCESSPIASRGTSAPPGTRQAPRSGRSRTRPAVSTSWATRHNAHPHCPRASVTSSAPATTRSAWTVTAVDLLLVLGEQGLTEAQRPQRRLVAPARRAVLGSVAMGASGGAIVLAALTLL